MIIVYHSYYNICLPFTAASIHCDNTTKVARIISCPFLLDFDCYIWGKLFFTGIDSFGNKIYFMAYNKAGSIFIRAIIGIISYLGIEKDQLIFIDTLRCANYYLNIGNFLLRMKLVNNLTKTFFNKGLNLAFQEISLLVEETLLQLEGMKESRRSK